MQKITNINIRVTPAEKELVKSVTDKLDISASEFIRQAIFYQVEYYKNMEELGLMEVQTNDE